MKVSAQSEYVCSNWCLLVIKDPPPYYHQVLTIVASSSISSNTILIPDGIYDNLKEAMRRGEDHR